MDPPVGLLVAERIEQGQRLPPDGLIRFEVAEPWLAVGWWEGFEHLRERLHSTPDLRRDHHLERS